jgi:hypothetical protein
MPKPAIALLSLLGAVVLVFSIVLAFQSTNSDSDLVLADFLLGAPVVLLTAGFSILTTSRAIRSGAIKFQSAAFCYAAVVLLAYCGFQITARYLIPADIRFDFSCPGNTGSYHAVQFYFKHDGRWLEGPAVEGWPLKVSFPDLNGDGHCDIRVVENGGTGSVEFVYLPQNDGHSFWRAVKNDSRLSAAYPPTDYFSNFP